ncbi:MAG: SusE domain-containing protein [Sphingobacteriales bacterium]|nr:SusE domain-containing protein [Sphingobacteriales bacterium]MBI3719435.1 SusE domain-containing protein [Sphingobacteriales bacterium]
MKTGFIKLFFITLAPLVLWSCKKDENKVYLESGASPALTLSSSTVTMAKATGSSNALKAAWSAAQFGYPSAVGYTLQVDKTGGNFASPYEVSIGTDRAKEFTQLELNTAFLGTGNTADQPGGVIMRVKAVLTGTSVAAVYSNTVSVTGTPYSLEPPSLYIPGGYQGWDPASATRIWAYSQTAPKKYDGYITLTDPSQLEFKITPKGNWDTDYGDGGGGNLQVKGPNFKVASVGTYRIQVDQTTLPGTYIITPLTAGWSIIGAAVGGWNVGNDVDMVYDQGTKVWSKTLTMADDEFKFRSNHDWPVNFGDGGSATLAGGKTLKYDGPNLKVPNGAGTYKVELILSGNENFSYKITKQ